MKFHTVRLGVNEIQKRWPARDRFENLHFGYNREAAQLAGWMTDVGGKRMNVLKQIVCNDNCRICNQLVCADQIS